MATILLRHPIFIKCWSCHFEGIISHTHKSKVFLLIYLNYDAVLSRHVLHYINEREQS